MWGGAEKLGGGEIPRNWQEREKPKHNQKDVRPPQGSGRTVTVCGLNLNVSQTRGARNTKQTFSNEKKKKNTGKGHQGGWEAQVKKTRL